MSAIYQTVIAVAVVAGITILTALRIVNGDAAVGVFFAILGYVFGVNVPTARRNGNGEGYPAP